ncbi:MAG: OsmC family protein [Armatimonadota bacterium]
MSSNAVLQVCHEKDFCFKLKCRDHEMTVDLPPGSGGTDSGPTPPELLAAALGSCVGVYVVEYCRRHGIPHEGLKIDVSWEDAKAPSRVKGFAVRVSLPEGVPAEHTDRLKKYAEQCKVHNTLIHKPEVELSIS